MDNPDTTSRLLTTAQLSAVLGHMRLMPRYRMLIAFSASSGPRPSELRELRWSDPDASDGDASGDESPTD